MTRKIPPARHVPLHPANRIENLRRRVKRARNFPDNTCPASRHVQLMAENLLRYGEYSMLQEEPEHCAASMLAIVEALYKARTQLAKLDKEDATVATTTAAIHPRKAKP